MLSPTFVPLRTVYRLEPDFTRDLAENLNLLKIGRFDESEVEAMVGTRKADIVAKGDDGVVVIECQFDRADWDHWGRLEAYARLRDAATAVLVAEDFEELMVATCELRNTDSKISWYLIKASLTANGEVFFQTVEGPKIDIQTDRRASCRERVCLYV